MICNKQSDSIFCRTDLETKGPVSSDFEIRSIELQNQLASANSRISELEVMLEQRQEKEAEDTERVNNTKVLLQSVAKYGSELASRFEMKQKWDIGRLCALFISAYMYAFDFSVPHHMVAF